MAEAASGGAVVIAAAEEVQSVQIINSTRRSSVNATEFPKHRTYAH